MNNEHNVKELLQMKACVKHQIMEIQNLIPSYSLTLALLGLGATRLPKL